MNETVTVITSLAPCQGMRCMLICQYAALARLPGAMYCTVTDLYGSCKLRVHEAMALDGKSTQSSVVKHVQ